MTSHYTIGFDQEAWDSWETAILKLEGFVVKIYPDFGEPFDAQLYGVDSESGSVSVRRYDRKGSAGPIGEVFGIHTRRIEVY